MFTAENLTVLGILLPFFGTALGAAAVWIVPRKGAASLQNVLYGFAAGVMLASLVWSLLIPALERGPSPFPVVAGFLIGIGFFLLCEGLFDRATEKGVFSGTKKMIFAVTLHNLPEGMAVGVAFAGALENDAVTLGSAMLLSIGISLQNLPEGSIISAPVAASGVSKKKAFLWGGLSGVVEPVGALLALFLTHLIDGILPFVLSFAAGAMLYVVCDELIPQLSLSRHKKGGLLSVGLGFALMMFMDVIFS